MDKYTTVNVALEASPAITGANKADIAKWCGGKPSRMMDHDSDGWCLGDHCIYLSRRLGVDDNERQVFVEDERVVKLPSGRFIGLNPQDFESLFQ